MKFKLLYEGIERRLSPGNFLVGRSPDCAVVLEDPLVSRHHAVIRVAADSVQIEDLGSRNGVVLGGVAIQEPTYLHHGDVVEIAGHKLQLMIGKGRLGLSPTARSRAATRPSEMFGVLSALADKALAMGQGSEAQRILGTHLDNVLSELISGIQPPDDICFMSLRYAARLAAATRRGHWFSYVFKMLQACGKTCPSEVLDELYAGASRADAMDLTEIRDYISFHTAQISQMNPRERFLLGRVQGLERLLSA